MIILVAFVTIMLLIICVGFVVIHKLMIEYYDHINHGSNWRTKKGDKSCGK